MTPRPNSDIKKRHRRTEAELIADLQAKIATLEDRKARKAAKADPTVRMLTTIVRQLKTAEKKFMAAGRLDLANAAKAATISLAAHARG